MIIKVGSLNPTKVNAVKNIMGGHELFENAVIEGVDVRVAEFDHPKTLSDTIKGARQRAKDAFSNCEYSVGLESGMFPAPETKSGYLETIVCVIYDGKQFHLGLGPSFEWPKEMVKLILKGYDGSQAFKELGLTNHNKIGTAEGGIYLLTHGKLNRTKQNELAVMMALIHLENPQYY